MMECQRADNDMHDNHSQAAAMRRTNVPQPARQFAAINSRRLVVAAHSHLSAVRRSCRSVIRSNVAAEQRT
jgi:hypothetical protein